MGMLRYEEEELSEKLMYANKKITSKPKSVLISIMNICFKVL